MKLAADYVQVILHMDRYQSPAELVAVSAASMVTL